MIIRFFKSRQPLVYPLYALIGFISWLVCASGFTVNTSNSMPLYTLLFKLIAPEHKQFYFFLGLSLVVSQAIYLNIICNKNQVLYKDSFLPGLFYMLFMCSLPQFISFHPLLIVNFILIFTLQKIFRLYKNDEPLVWDFDTCVLLSIMSLCYLPAVLFVLLYAIGLLILRPFSWRDWVVGLMGFVTPIFFLLLYYFLTDRLGEIRNLVLTTEFNHGFNIKNAVPSGYHLTILWVVSLFVLSLLKIRLNFLKNSAKTRNYQFVILVFVIVSLLMIIFTPSEMLIRFSIICIPLSIIIAYYFLATKKIWITESLFYMLIFLIIYNYISIK